MKKVYAWLSDEERDALARYCEREGRSMYSVLKEAVVRVIQGEAPITPMAPITPKEDGGLVAPSLEPVQRVSPEVLERLGTVERGVNNLAKEVDKLTGNEKLWSEVGELQQRVTKLEGIKMEELRNEFAKMLEDTLVSMGKSRSLKERE